MIGPGTVIDDRYELVKTLATGGMGQIYLARSRSAAGFGRLVAIKILLPHLSSNPGFVQMFLDEARNVARLRHENIAQIYDIAEVEGHFYMVMEYIPGQNLRELLGNASIPDRPLFEPRLGAEVFAQLADALAVIHTAGLVHRDLSPNNIMIGDEGIAKVIDFGVARALGAASLTNPGTLKGKFTYMAPEYIKGAAYDHRVDLFSFGIVMWETFARKRLFRGDSAAEQLHQVLASEIIPLDRAIPGFPSPLSDIVMHALSRDPDRRIASGSALAEQLRGVAGTLPTPTDPTLRRWLERRIAPRMDERRRQIDEIMNREATPSGAEFASDLSRRLHRPSIESPLPAMRSGPTPVGASVEPLPAMRSGPTPRQRITGFTSAPSVGSGSVGLASGEVTPSSSRRAQPRGRLAIAGALLAATVLAIGGWITLRRPHTESVQAARPAARVDAADAPADKPAGDPHKVAGLAAMQAKDYATAIAEFAAALRVKPDPEVIQLMQLARTLQQEAARQK